MKSNQQRPMHTSYPKILIAFFALIFSSASVYSQCGTVDFTASNTKGCAPLGSEFVAKNVPSGAKIEWDFGGGFITGKDTAFKFFTSGKSDVRLRITLSGQTTACTTVTKVDHIEVLPKPKIDLYRSDSVLCNGVDNVVIEDKTPGVAVRQWIFDGVTETSTGTTLNKSPSLGDHSLNLIVENSFGCESVYKNNKAIIVRDPVGFEICANITQEKGKTTANFSPNVLSTKTKPTGYEWFFPGASPSTSVATNPKGVTYTNPSGDNKVTLEMTMPSTCVYTFEKADFIKEFLSVDLDSSCIDQQIEVINHASGGGRGDYSMSFPGAKFISGDVKDKFYISYGTVGAKTLTYSYKYNSGDDACETKVRTPGLTIVRGPQARAFSNDKTDCTLDTVEIQSNSNVPGYGKNTYTWMLFDKDSVHVNNSPFAPKVDLKSIKYKFPQQGVYSVLLRVKNSITGCEDEVYLKNYLRLQAPVARIKFSDSVICTDKGIEMESKAIPKPSSGNPYTYAWNVNHIDSANVRFDGAGKKLNRTFRIPGLYDVRLIVKSNSTCADTLLLDKKIEVKGILAKMITDTARGCPNYTSNFSSQIDLLYPASPTPQYNYKWSVFPDGATIDDDDADNTDITFTESSCFSVSLEINDVHGCKKKLSSPSFCVGTKANFGWDEDTLNQLCLNEPFQLIDSSGVNPTKYQWSVDKRGLSFDDSTANAPFITFHKAGTYKIKLKLSSGGSSYCLDSIEREIEIIAPEAKFKIDKPITQCAPQQITFTNESKNSDTYEWYYGDGVSSTNSSPEHLYIYTLNNISGFVAKLVAYKSGIDECADTFEVASKVKIVGPSPLFSMDTLSGCDTQNVEFFNLTNPINAEYLFDYGDGSSLDTNKIRKHTYFFNGEPGEDSVIYYPTIVASSFGCDAFYKDTIIIYRNPRAKFIADTIEGCKPLTINFINQSSTSHRFYWDFWNDNVPDSINEDTVTITIDTVGKFGFSIYNEIGACRAEFVKDSLVKVSNAPTAKFELVSNRLCESHTITFTNKTVPATSRFVMDYGDGTIGDTSVLSDHVYKVPNGHPIDSIVFYPKLTAMSYGCENVFIDTIVVFKAPIADFVIDQVLGCQPIQVELINKSVSNTGIEWDFYNDNVIDGTKDTLRLNLDTFGYFDVKLTALSSGVCNGEKRIDSLVRVVQNPVAEFTMDVVKGCDSLVVSFGDSTKPAFTDFTFDYGDGSVLENNVVNTHTYYLPNGFTGDSMIFIPEIKGTRVLCDADFSDTIILYKSPTADFTAMVPTEGCQPYNLEVLNTSTKSNLLVWDVFNDTIIDGKPIPAADSLFFQTDSIGSWSLRLYAEYLNGCNSSKVIDSFFTVRRVPVADISLDTMRGCDEALVDFTTNNPLDSFMIIYGNGATDIDLVNPARYEFPAANISDSALFVSNYIVYNRDFPFCTDVQSDSIWVFRNPTATFVSSVTRGCAPLEIEFTNTTLRAKFSDWDFDKDGLSDDTARIAKPELANGDYSIGLMVETVEGCRDTLYKESLITVYDLPEVKLEASRLISCPNDPITFRDISILDTTVAGRTWDFGPDVIGDRLVIPSPAVSFDKEGIHWIYLSVTDSHFCTSSDSMKIEIVNTTPASTEDFLNLNYTISTGTSIDWTPSNARDFESYTLIRVTEDDSTQTDLKSTNYADVANDFTDLVKYYIQVTDTCKNISVFSEPVSKLILQGDNNLENVLRLRWKYLKPNNYAYFKIYRRDPSGTFAQIDSIDGTDRKYHDSTACAPSYVYRIEGVTVAGAVSMSNEIPLTSKFSKRTTALEFYKANVRDNEKLILNWEANTHGGQAIYIIDRAKKDKVWQIGYDSTEGHIYEDTLANVQDEYYYYRVYSKDHCGHINPISNLGTSIWLHGTSDNGAMEMKWNKVDGWKDNYDFIVQQRFGSSAFKDLVKFDDSGVSYTDENLYNEADTPWCYRIVAVQNFGRKDSIFSNYFCDYLSYEVFVPNAFSPNGDGVNDTFLIGGQALRRIDQGGIKSYNLKIVDRWGEILFKSTDPNVAWDGKKGGEYLPLGQYWYILDIQTKDGEGIDEEGALFIIK